MKPKFEIGNFARRKSDGKIVKVALAKYGWIAYDENVLTAKSCPMEELEPCGPKTAFLTRLQELLATFDAKIESVAQGSEESWIDIYFSKEHIISFISEEDCYGVTINAENVFDYGKE